MSAIKTVVVLLAVALLGSQAAPIGPDCDGLNKTLSQEDLYKANGNWVLVWSVSIGLNSEGLLRNMSSSYMVMTLHPDNSTLTFHEKHMHGEVCTLFTTNLTVTSEENGSKLSTNNAELERHGKMTVDNASEEVRIFESCADCLNLKFASESGGHTLMIYKREGHHRDLEVLKTFYSDYEKLAECLNVPQDLKFTYDGAADFCHKKSSPEEKSDES